MNTNTANALVSPGKILILLAVMTLITACTKTQAPEQLVFADPNQAMVSLVYIAEAQSYFRDENLSVTYKKFTSGRDAMNSVLAGEADVGVATEFPFANNLLQGKPLRILGTLYRTNHNDAVVARGDRGIQGAADLAGKRIGVTPNTNSEFMLSTILREEAIPEDKVTRVPLKPEQMADALERGEVDGIATWLPHIAAAQERFASDQTSTLRTPGYIALSLLGVRFATLAEKHEALQRLIRALVRAEDFVNAHRDEALQIVVDHLASEQPEKLQEAWPELKFQVRLDNILLTALVNEGRWLAARATPPQPVPDYQATLAPEFLEAIRPQYVTVQP